MRKRCKFLKYLIFIGFYRKTCFQPYNSLNKTSFSVDLFPLVVVFHSDYIVEESASKLGISLRIEFEFESILKL
jgi:hypothetical protein